MTLHPVDWIAVAAYLLITLFLGLYFRGRSGKDMSEYFVSGREVSWWLAGTSMVATTFAADTPLVVTGLVYKNGIAGNWIWWSFLLSGMMTVFLFARLWRRSGLITDVQFAEMRYAGKPAAFLRGFRAIYLGLLMNCLILGWVTKAMITITQQLLGVSLTSAVIICVLVLIPFTGLYVSLGGLWGVLWTDLFQFVLKMAIVIGVAFYAVRASGGMSAMIAKLNAGAAANNANASSPLHFFPDFSRGFTGEAIWALPVITFCVYLGLQWWAFWYPGAEPGGGGYIAQRIFSSKNERHGLLSVLWFNVAHYAVRPWPWILTALAVIVLYPGMEHPEQGYMKVVTDYVPRGFIGIIIAGFLAAFMSTVATQLNWGASYLIADFYRRFLKKDGTEKHYVNASRIATVILVICAAIVAWRLTSIGEGWTIVLEVGAGTGAVYMLRWYWWRINAISEIAAMGTALATTFFIHSMWMLRLFGLGVHYAAGYTPSAFLDSKVSPFTGSDPVLFAKSALTTTLVTTVVWIVATLVTHAEPEDVLVRFYRHVHPDVRGWKRVAALAPEVPQTRDLGRNLWLWVLGCAMVYCALFGLGKLLLGAPWLGLGLLVGGALCAWGLSIGLTRAGWGGPEQTPSMPAKRREIVAKT
jgi:solute:Na+ symporter, SSS family